MQRELKGSKKLTNEYYIIVKLILLKNKETSIFPFRLKYR